uniref:Uncharacterized protein n=1 Tax=Romanomermis culicivorax TaxID=13658 RepID=A0A915JH61_ROMCU
MIKPEAITASAPRSSYDVVQTQAYSIIRRKINGATWIFPAPIGRNASLGLRNEFRLVMRPVGARRSHISHMVEENLEMRKNTGSHDGKKSRELKTERMQFGKLPKSSLIDHGRRCLGLAV